MPFCKFGSPCLFREKTSKGKSPQLALRQPRQGPTDEAQMAAAAALARLEQKQPRARGPTSQDSIRNQGEFRSRWHLGWTGPNGKGPTEGRCESHVAGDTISSCLDGDMEKTGTGLPPGTLAGGLLALRPAPAPHPFAPRGSASGFRLGSFVHIHTFLLSVRKELQAEATSSNNLGAPGTNSVRYLLGTAQCSGAVWRQLKSGEAEPHA